MILSKAKDEHRYRYHHHPGHGLARTLAVIASLAILATAAVVVVHASAAEEATPFKVDEAFTVVPADEAFKVNAPTNDAPNNVPNDAGIAVEPYPDDFEIGIGEGESLLFAGTWAYPTSKMWTNFFVESDVPVILNRITAGPYSRLSWGAPGGGVVSVIVKTNCNNNDNNNNNNNDTILESEMMEMEIDPIVSTEMVTVFGQTIPKISIMALAEDDNTILPPPPPPPSNPSIPLAESRMADQENGDSPNFLPSSDFTHDYECWGWRTCAPTKNEKSSLAAQAAAASPETGSMDAVTDRPAPTDGPANAAAAAADTDPLAGSSSSNSSTIDTTDSVTDRPAPTDGPAGSTSPIATTTSTTTNGASASASSAFSANKITTVNLLLGMVTTASLLIVGGTVDVVFDKHQRNTMIRAATAIAIFGVMFVAILPPPAHSLLSSLEDADGGSRQSLNDAQQTQCVINVEIVYWGCDHQVFIDAPGISLRNGVETSKSDWETCECQEQQRFVNTTTTTTTTSDRRAGDEKNPETMTELGIINDLSGEHSMVYHVAGDNLNSSCLMAIGRPYRDKTGNIVSAGICDVTEDETNETDEHEHEHEHSGSEMEQSWSEPSLSFLSSNVVANLGGIKDDHRNHRRLGDNGTQQQKKERQRLGKEWTDRALGEHASVASFAAFTLALLSNQAPPELIRDSLTAAQDELRHAKVSFEIASMLSSSSIEPTALPPSTLQFDANLTALALGTAREGCVEETLSAIEMAVEYDEFVAAAGGDGDDGSDDFVATTLTPPIMETTKIIALEEGNHSVLAWRTIAWICSSSSSSGNNNSNEACKAMHQQVLDPSKLAQAGQKRFPSSPRARQIWDCIWTSLLPAIAVSGKMNDDDTVAVNGTTTKEKLINGYEKCSSFLDDIRVVGDDDTNAATLSELLAHKIVSQVRSEDAIVGAKKGIAETK